MHIVTPPPPGSYAFWRFDHPFRGWMDILPPPPSVLNKLDLFGSNFRRIKIVTLFLYNFDICDPSF